MLISAIALSWVIVMAAACVAWSRFHRHVRAIEGVDEAEYVCGLDEVSLREAA